MEKIYVGRGKIINGKYGDFTKLNLKLEDLNKYDNGKGYVNILVNTLKEPDKYGNTLSVSIEERKEEVKKEVKDDLDLPF